MLEAYEILARSGVFNAYSVAPERTVLPLQSGASQAGSSLDFVPHFSCAEYDAQFGRAPDLIVVPWFESGYSPQNDAAVLDWIHSHFGTNTTILGICIGAAHAHIRQCDVLCVPLPSRPYKVFSSIPFGATASIVYRLTRAENAPHDAYLVMPP